MGCNAYMVNGQAEKCDGNFMENFVFTDLQNLNLLIGSYPNSEKDVRALA